jgi:hypothetical protein
MPHSGAVDPKNHICVQAGWPCASDSKVQDGLGGLVALIFGKFSVRDHKKGRHRNHKKGRHKVNTNCPV